MKSDVYYKMARDFILREGQGPSIGSYIQSIAETLSAMKPNTVSDARRLEVARENLLNIRRHVRRLEDKLICLEEELKVLQEERENKGRK